jgi:hypothetical protein
LEGMSNWLLERSSSEMANRAMEARYSGPQTAHGMRLR